MYYAVFLQPFGDYEDCPERDLLIFKDIKEARAALKKYKGARMKGFDDYEKAKAFLENPNCEDSFIELETSLTASLERLSIKEQETFPSAETSMLNKLRRNIESGKYEEVDEAIWSNPRYLVTVCDSATYLMAGPKYNACHIAARSNKPDIMALLLDTVSNPAFLRKLYPEEPDQIVQERINHVVDSYLNTPEPKQGNTPLHFACKMGFYKVVRVLLTFEGCDLNLKDVNGQTAEESVCSRVSTGDGDRNTDILKDKIRNLFKCQLHLPLYRDQLKKRLILEKRRKKAAAGGSDYEDSDLSFSDDSFISNSSKNLA